MSLRLYDPFLSKLQIGLARFLAGILSMVRDVQTANYHRFSLQSKSKEYHSKQN
jgi:hypothetical protein